MNTIPSLKIWGDSWLGDIGRKNEPHSNLDYMEPLSCAALAPALDVHREEEGWGTINTGWGITAGNGERRQ